MQKKIIALAIASMFAAPALALADAGNVVVYGQANVSYDLVKTGDRVAAPAKSNQGVNDNRVSSNESRLGLKGSEDLGGGLSAIWQIESEVTFDGSRSNHLGTRNTFAGLASTSMGTLTLGRMDTPYKVSTRKLDVFADSIADNRSLMGGGNGNTTDSWGFDERATDSVNYTTPNFNNGFSFSAAYSNQAEERVVGTDEKYTLMSFAGSYDMAPLYATVAYTAHKWEDQSVTPIPSVTDKATKLGVGYSNAGLDLGLVYEKTSDNDTCTGGDCYGHKAYYLSAKFSVNATDAIKAAYTKSGVLGNDGASNAETGAKQVSVGYDHALSKRTTVYALYTKLTSEKNYNYMLYNSNTNGFDGASPSAFSFGMKHSF